MTLKQCDRCSTVSNLLNIDTITINKICEDEYIFNGDLCHDCERKLRDFLKKLPVVKTKE